MSWTASTEVAGRQKIAGKKLSLTPAPYGPELEPHVREQVDAACDAANALIASGALGKSKAGYLVTLSGHANPEHKPAAGWSNDSVSVSIAQKDAG